MDLNALIVCHENGLKGSQLNKKQVLASRSPFFGDFKGASRRSVDPQGVLWEKPKHANVLLFYHTHQGINPV
jgi:hypothetical protein